MCGPEGTRKNDKRPRAERVERVLWMVSVQPVKADMSNRKAGQPQCRSAVGAVCHDPVNKDEKRHMRPDENCCADLLGQSADKRQQSPFVATDRIKLVRRQKASHQPECQRGVQDVSPAPWQSPPQPRRSLPDREPRQAGPWRGSSRSAARFSCSIPSAAA